MGRTPFLNEKWPKMAHLWFFQFPYRLICLKITQENNQIGQLCNKIQISGQNKPFWAFVTDRPHFFHSFWIFPGDQLVCRVPQISFLFMGGHFWDPSHHYKHWGINENNQIGQWFSYKKHIGIIRLGSSWLSTIGNWKKITNVPFSAIFH